MKIKALLPTLLACCLLTTAGTAEQRQVLRVCADPNSMPLSHRNQQGYENRIAQLLADKLSLPLEYTWFPQRRGFVRKTLRDKDPQTGGYRCDLIIGVPTSFELATTTEPYYRSTYALVFKADGVLGDVTSVEEFLALPPERRAALRVGVFEQTPGAVWLAQHGMIRQIVPYITLNADPDAYPGQVIEQELQNDKIDAAIVWGPIAGYFATKSAAEHNTELRLLPLRSLPGIRFDFPISMAVRFGEGEWKQQLQSLLDQHQAEIQAILREYSVPLIDQTGNPLPR